MPKVSKYISSLLLIFIGLSEFISAQGPLFEVKSLSLNLANSSQIAPVLYKDGIIFCSDRRISSVKQTTTYNDDHLYNIFIAERKDTARWSVPQEIKVTSASILYGGPLCIAPDGKTVYFTSAVLSGKAARNRNVKNPLGIFMGELSGTDIINVIPFEYNDPLNTYNVGHPSISRDGKYLFFASDKAGGQGGSDLYYCELINSKWSAPVNLGSKVNSSSKEDYPYMHPTGRLYFSSDRLGGLGGLDIFYTTLSMGSWQDPVALPPQINSASDDFAFVAEDNLQTGYFTSTRNRNNDEIFKFSSNIIRKVNCDSLQENNYCYEFFDSNAVNMVKSDTAKFPFIYTWYFGDGAIAEGVHTEHCYLIPGRYEVRLDVLNTITKKVKKDEKIIPVEVREIEQPYISAPGTWTTGKQLKLNADSTNLPGWDIRLYYWNFGDETVAIGKEVNKTFLKPGSYDIQLIVTSNPGADGIIKEKCVLKNINVIR
jgi:hypothetical protein